MSARRVLGGCLAVCAAVSSARAEDRGLAGAAYGAAAAEVSGAGLIALYLTTPASPGSGVGLALNYAPLAIGIGAGVVAGMNELDPRYPLGFHGALAGGLPLLALGAAFDGRDAENGVRLGPAAVSLGMVGAAAGAYLGATRIDTAGEAGAFIAAPFAGALGGGITYAVVHFFDDEGPRGTGRLVRYAGAGMLLGTVGSLIYAFPDRGTGTSARVAPSVSAHDRATIVSFGGRF